MAKFQVNQVTLNRLETSGRSLEVDGFLDHSRFQSNRFSPWALWAVEAVEHIFLDFMLANSVEMAVFMESPGIIRVVQDNEAFMPPGVNELNHLINNLMIQLELELPRVTFSYKPSNQTWQVVVKGDKADPSNAETMVKLLRKNPYAKDLSVLIR